MDQRLSAHPRHAQLGESTALRIEGSRFEKAELCPYRRAEQTNCEQSSSEECRTEEGL